MKRVSPSGVPQRQEKRSSKRSKAPAPAFSDVTASVAAATFAARRLPEMRRLYAQDKSAQASLPRSLLDTTSLKSGGGKTSARHLRRRATSFQPRRRHRYPHRKRTDIALESGGGDDGGSNGLPSAIVEDRTQAVPCRRKQRRNKKFLVEKHSAWTEKSTTVPKHGPGDTVDKAPRHLHWIPTHLWYAKRFRMVDLWGWQIPMMHTNRGTRAALRLAQDHAIVQDVTWRTTAQAVAWQVTERVTPAFLQSLGRILVGCDLSRLSHERPQLHSLEDGNDDATLLYGECMLYQTDQNPQGAIGPVTYMVRRRPLVQETKSKGFFFYLWGHACLEDKLWELVHAVLDIEYVHGLSRGIDGGLGCLELRGKSPLLCLQQCLGTETLSSKFCFPGATRNPGELRPMRVSGSHSIIDCIPERCRDVSLSCNSGVSGINIFASPEQIRHLFLQLILLGRACPIGLVEDIALRLEAQPPLPVFPRDYPDTEAGTAYWQPEKSRDWALLREYDYGTSGRIRNSILTSTSITWTRLCFNGAKEIILVRGSYLDPFRKAWKGLDGPESTMSGHAIDEKKRRPVKNPTSLRKIPKPPADFICRHQSFCQGLSLSLTLPAAVLCHVCIDGPGKIAIGTPLFSWNRDDEDAEPIGYACSGSFSPCRGTFHGMAIAGAKALLEVIGMAHMNEASVATRKTPSGERTYILVRVGRMGNVRGGLSLL